MGMSYEARALVAVWSADAPAFEHFAALTASEYRHGAKTTLAARYERLINEAARCGMRTRVSLSDFEALAGVGSSALGRDELLSLITRTIAGSRDSDERTQLALQMICTAYRASVGRMYLVTPAGLVLRASVGMDGPQPELARRITDYVEAKRQRAQELDDMVTGAWSQYEALPPLIQVAGESYEVLPLGCVVDSTSTLVGVVAIAVTEKLVRNVRQAQLLNAIATSLLNAGDSAGLRLSASD